MAAAGTPDEAADDPPSEGEVAMEGRGRPVGAHQHTSALPVEVDRQDVEQGLAHACVIVLYLRKAFRKMF